MTPRFLPGQIVQTPLGKGVVLDVRNQGRVVAQVQGRAVVFDATDLAPAPAGRSKRRPPDSTPDAAANPRAATSRSAARVRTLDLHGLTVDAALDTLTSALNNALLEDVSELRVVHGRGGGRIRAAVQRRLRDLPFVRAYRLDPQNQGVTIVVL